MTDDKITKNKEYFKKIAKGIHLNMVENYSNLNTAKQNRMTEVSLSAAVKAYCDANVGSNCIAASADKQRTHLKEQHPNLKLETPLTPPLDLHMTGGERDLSLESEVGGMKAVKHDFKKLQDRPISDDKVMITEAKSFKGIGKFTKSIQKTSKEDKGNYIHVEVHRQKNAKANTAVIYTTAYTDGKLVYSDTSKKEEKS